MVARRVEPSHRRIVTLKQLLDEQEWLTERYVRRLVAERKIGFFKTGDGRSGKLLFDAAEFEEYIQRHRVEPRRPA